MTVNVLSRARLTVPHGGCDRNGIHPGEDERGNIAVPESVGVYERTDDKDHGGQRNDLQCGIRSAAGEECFSSENDLPVERVDHALSEEKRKCPVCGCETEEIGTEIKRTLVITPPSYSVREDVYHIYVCKTCEHAFGSRVQCCHLQSH